jgi:hypothetical protein
MNYLFDAPESQNMVSVDLLFVAGHTDSRAQGAGHRVRLQSRLLDLMTYLFHHLTGGILVHYNQHL